MQTYETIDQLTGMLPVDHADYESMKLTLSMASGILKENDGVIDEDDPDIDFKNQILTEANEIVQTMFVSKIPHSAQKAPETNNCGCRTDIHIHPQPCETIRIFHEPQAYQRQDGLTSFATWVIVPFVVSFMLMAAVLLMR